MRDVDEFNSNHKNSQRSTGRRRFTFVSTFSYVRYESKYYVKHQLKLYSRSLLVESVLSRPSFSRG